MQNNSVGALVWVAVIVVVAILFLRNRRRPTLRMGPGAAGSIYDMLNKDKQNAIEIIVEERAGARDPEDADGNLPDLEHPKQPS